VVGVGENVTAGWNGRQVTVDGSKGVVYAGRLETAEVPTASIAGLDQLLAWAREASPVNVVEGTEDDVLDLDRAGLTVAPDAAPDVDDLVARMRGRAAVRGSVLSTSEGAVAVVRSGVPTVVMLPGQHPATLLLRLVQGRQP
jgi:pyruvate,orthophosphate dikinase